MDIALLYLILGMVLLTWSSDKFIFGSINIAKHFNVSPLLIGLTIVSLGTSAPEIMVSIIAAISGKTDLAVANVIGSNIANIGFVLGLTAIVKPIKVKSQILRREYVILSFIMLALALMFWDGNFMRYEGVILCLMLLSLMGWFVYQARADKDALLKEYKEFEKNTYPMWKSILYFLLGVILLPISANIVVIGASSIAGFFGVSQVLIGLTIVAVGTSLPEVGASISASLKGEEDIAIGNVIGSNMLNIVAVLPFVALISPGPIEYIMIRRDMPVMVGMVIVLWCFLYFAKYRLSRVHGILLLLCYSAYIALLVKGEIIS